MSKIIVLQVTGYIRGVLNYQGQQYPNETIFSYTVNSPIGGIQFSWEYSTDGTPYGVAYLSSGGQTIKIISGIATLPNFEEYWVVDTQITDIQVVSADCASGFCKIDCPSSPDGFCCMSHSLTNQLLQLLQ